MEWVTGAVLAVVAVGVFVFVAKKVAAKKPDYINKSPTWGPSGSSSKDD